jgi:hypothetical protein
VGFLGGGWVGRRRRRRRRVLDVIYILYER